MATAEMTKPIFPPAERVIYKDAPLIEVICQVRFPADLRIEKEPPAEFQQRVKKQFPFLNEKTQSITTGLPDEVARVIEAIGPQSGAGKVWQFASQDRKARLDLTKENLTLVSTSYVQWEQFFGQLYESPLRALIELYSPPFFTRIGLRYRDLIRRSRIGLADVPWSRLLNGYVLGELGFANVSENAEEVARKLVLRLDNNGAKVLLQHGFAAVSGSHEQCYLIDCDFFVDRQTETGHGSNTIEQLHTHAFSYFRWCITDELHDAMEPQPLAST